MFFYYLNCFKRCFDFKGRSNRSEFWSFSILNLLIYALITVIDIYIYPDIELYKICALSSSAYTFILITFIPGLSLSIRRLHDINRNWKWWLINFIPLGCIVLVAFYLKRGVENKNKYGNMQKPETKHSQKNGGIFYVGLLSFLFVIAIFTYFFVKKPDGIFESHYGEYLLYCEGVATYKNGYKNGSAEYNCSRFQEKFHENVEFKDSIRLSTTRIFNKTVEIVEGDDILGCKYTKETYEMPEKILIFVDYVSLCGNNNINTRKHYDQIGNLVWIDDRIADKFIEYYHNNQKKEKYPLHIKKECSQGVCKEYYYSGELKRLTDRNLKKMEEFSEDNKLVAIFTLGNYPEIEDGICFDKNGNKRKLNQAELLAHTKKFQLNIYNLDREKEIIDCK